MPPESASLITVDPLHDVALLQIASPRSAVTVVGLSQIVPHGSSCGAFGFPLASMDFGPTGLVFNLVERFQGAYSYNDIYL